MPADPLNALERELSVLLRRSRVLTSQVAGSVHPEVDLSAYGFLVWLDEAEEGRATELATYFGLTKPTVSRQLALLERVGLVERRPDPDDGRAQVVALTDLGRTRMQGVRRTRHERFHGVMAGWPAEDVERLAELLARLNDTFS